MNRTPYLVLFCFTGYLTYVASELGVDETGNLPGTCKQLRTSIHTNGNPINQYDEHSGNMRSMNEEHGFELRVRRMSDGLMVSGWYEPGSEYSVTLTNRYQLVGFRDAIMWLEFGEIDSRVQMDTDMMSEKSSTKHSGIHDRCTHHHSLLGTWIHRPGGSISTQPRVGCKGLTAERYNNVKVWVSQISSSWAAPTENPNLPGCKTVPKLPCVTIRAAVQARGGHNSVYNSTGGLTKTLCPSVNRPPSPVLPVYMVSPEKPESSKNGKRKHLKSTVKMMSKDSAHIDTMQPKDCCACGSATYNLTFQGLWTKETHPKDWPTHKPGLLHWTNLIGASHMPNYRIYQFGEQASAGVSAVCTYGDTTVLKQSLGIAAANTQSSSGIPTGSQRGAVGVGPLHSLITTPGMWSEETLTESRSTLVGVNRTHPLISFLTMLGPSPNWCAGLASQSVCQADCTWVKRLQVDLFPWDAGVQHGDTYIPKVTERKDFPDPIRYITRDWMPNHPFTPHLPVARVTLERVLPKQSWQCTSEYADGVELFKSDGSTEVLGARSQGREGKRSEPVQSVVGDLFGGILKKSRTKSGGGGGGGGGLGGDSPLSDPSLAQMATFLCITDSWSAWGPCSVTCGVGRRERTRVMLVNKKNELCQHVPLIEEETCEGRKRTCDFSSPCSLLPWTDWTPCNATCQHRSGQQSRRRYLVRPEERDECLHLFNTTEELANNAVVEKRSCGPTDNECDPVSICGEGRKDGLLCGDKVTMYHYSAVDHKCLPFEYLGCKGGRNRFVTKAACESMCLEAVENLPGWRRERMALLQYQTSQITTGDGRNQKKNHMKPKPYCALLMDPGEPCAPGENNETTAWYFSPRTRRCFEFVYLGCGGNENRFYNYSSCLSTCLPEEWEKSQQMAKALAATSKASKTDDSHLDIWSQEKQQQTEDSDVSQSELNRIGSMWGPKQDCRLTNWGGWSPCSINKWNGSQMRWRHIIKPARHGGKPCGVLFERRDCQRFRW